MTPEKFVINAAEGTQEIIIREGAAPKVLDPQAPLPFGLVGTLNCVQEFLLKRVNSGQFSQLDSTILVNRNDLSIVLLFNERDAYNKGSVRGTLEYHPDFECLGINRNVTWTPVELAMHLKMHRYLFTDLDAGMKLISTLMNYSANIQQKVDQSVEANGNRSDSFAQVVNSNLPKSITLNIPVFKGSKPQSLEIEFFAKVDGRNVSFFLMSPGANEIVNDFRDKSIDKELEAIRAIAPNIAIIEQ